jgi:adenylate cyclase
LDRANVKLKQRDEAVLNELRPLVAGKICLVGYTATALGDVVATPVDPAMPGVMVHANVINMFLQNRFASEASRGVNLAIILFAGFVTTLTSCARGSRFSLLSLFVLVAGILGVGAAMFWAITYHFASLVVVATVILVWASVTVYRQATEERARRTFQRALAQYTSPAVAARIAERTKADDLAPQQALVTCFFSDLADFTRLSERLGPQQTRRLLDPYLRGVSAALLDHHAIINKFMGDGVFAFFNAPILPCTNHARAACASALASLAAVARCNDQRRQSGEADSLTVRIGLSTGVAFVGDYGSDMKLDYTCIGDTVNLGSRLERANKAFGTAILVDDATRRTAGDGFVFRSLGLIEVAGRAAAVAVHELVGLASGVDEQTRRYIEMFEKAIGDFQHCRWDSCLAILAQCRKLRPLDRAVGLYEEEVARCRVIPRTSAWAGLIPINVH